MAIHCCCCVLRPACYCYGCVCDEFRQNLYRKIILNCAVGNSFSEARRDVRMVLITRTVRSLRHQRPERCVGRRWVLRLVLCNCFLSLSNQLLSGPPSSPLGRSAQQGVPAAIPGMHPRQDGKSCGVCVRVFLYAVDSTLTSSSVQTFPHLLVDSNIVPSVFLHGSLAL